eukprot:470990_1
MVVSLASHLNLSANVWTDFPSLSISYLYHDHCELWSQRNANNICIGHGGIGVASVPTRQHWNAILSVITTQPIGFCTRSTNGGYSYIGVGATSYDTCSVSEKNDSYKWWNDDHWNTSAFDWQENKPDYDCESQRALKIQWRGRMDDGLLYSNYSIHYLSPTQSPTFSPVLTIVIPSLFATILLYYIINSKWMKNKNNGNSFYLYLFTMLIGSFHRAICLFISNLYNLRITSLKLQ